MVGEELPNKEEIRNLLIELLLLPSKSMSPAKFEKLENEISVKLERLVHDPYWSDYLFFSRKFDLLHPMIEKEDGEFVVDEVALEVILEKILSYKHIIL